MNSLRILSRFALMGSLVTTVAQAQIGQANRIQELHPFLNEQYADPNYRSAVQGDDVLHWAYAAIPTAHLSNGILQLPGSPAARIYTDIYSLRNLDLTSGLQQIQALCILVNSSADLNLVIPADKLLTFPALRYIIFISSIPLCAEQSEATECQASTLSALFRGELPASIQIFYTISIPE